VEFDEAFVEYFDDRAYIGGFEELAFGGNDVVLVLGCDERYRNRLMMIAYADGVYILHGGIGETGFDARVAEGLIKGELAEWFDIGAAEADLNFRWWW